MLVTLTANHRALATKAAHRAAETKKELNLADSPAYQTLVDLDPFDRDYLGALAELAVAEYLDLPWGAYDLGAVDVGHDIEVRRVTQPNRGPMIRPKDYNDPRIQRHVAVYVWTDKSAEILGWVPTETAWTKGRECACTRAGTCCKIFHDSNSLQLASRHLRRPDTMKDIQK